jgi:hypothetical protein
MLFFIVVISCPAGARIHSNSWGGGYWYDAFCIETDSYLYENEDFAIIYAAGNDGSHGIETILSPGLSKNALAVGCTVGVIKYIFIK